MHGKNKTNSEFCFVRLNSNRLIYRCYTKLCYTDVDSFVIHIITEYFFEAISGDVQRWFDTSNYDENYKRPLPIGKNKRVPGIFKDELGCKIIAEVVALRPKTWVYLMDDGSEKKKPYLKNNEDLKGIIMMCTQKTLIRLC